MSDTSTDGHRRAARGDLLAGGAFVAFGGAFAIGALGYDLGSALQMGTGYVPLLLGCLLVGLGLLIVFQGVVALRADGDTAGATAAQEDERGPVPWRRGGLLVAAVMVFGLTVDGLGLGVSIFVSAFLAALSAQGNTLLKSLLVAAGLTVVCLVVFVALLQLRLPLVGEWIGG